MTRKSYYEKESAAQSTKSVIYARDVCRTFKGREGGKAEMRKGEKAARESYDCHAAVLSSSNRRQIAPSPKSPYRPRGRIKRRLMRPGNNCTPLRVHLIAIIRASSRFASSNHSAINPRDERKTLFPAGRPTRYRKRIHLLVSPRW